MKFKFMRSVFVGLVLTFSGFASAGVIALEDWFDAAGTHTGGLTQSQFSDDLYFAVAQDVNFSLTDTYEVSQGWHIASFAEYTALRNAYTGPYTGFNHYNMNGWAGYTTASGTPQSYYFALSDMFTPDNPPMAIHAGHLSRYTYTTRDDRLGSDLTTNGEYFAGLIVIKDGSRDWGEASEVPEPSTLAIFALGMIGLASRRFKKQS